MIFETQNSPFGLYKIIFEPTSDFLVKKGFGAKNNSRDYNKFLTQLINFEPKVDFSSRNLFFGVNQDALVKKNFRSKF